MIQIDLPMPEACDVCPLNYDFCWCEGFNTHEEWEKYCDDWNEQVCEAEHRPEYCPLKEQTEIVRCKDCKFWYKDECSHLCKITGDLHPANWFCADGERNE